MLVSTHVITFMIFAARIRSEGKVQAAGVGISLYKPHADSIHRMIGLYSRWH